MKTSYTAKRICQVLAPDERLLQAPDMPIIYLAYDTRKLFHAAESLFFALRFKRNGHDYIEDAYQKGIRNFVVESSFQIPIKLRKQCNWIVVPDTWKAIQTLGAFHRKQFSIPFIGITGSNGKTLVKEWLFQLLSIDKKVYRTPKSMNSQLGVALSLWELQEEHSLAIIEAGISEINEMSALAQMIMPDIGIFTNLGVAHQEGFHDLKSKGFEKIKLFENASVWIGSENLEEHLKGHPTLLQAKFWKIQRLKNIEDFFGTEIELEFQGESHRFCIPFRDFASIENAAHVYTCMLLLGYSTSWLSERMPHLLPVEMRLELKSGHHQRTIIDDSYSNDPHALGIALDFLNQQQQHPVRCLIFSDFHQMDGSYEIVAQRIKEAGIDLLFSVGPETYKRKNQLGARKHFAYRDLDSLMNDLPQVLPSNSSVLIKGARKYGFERIGRYLSAQSHQTTLEIDMSSLEYNLRLFRGQLRPDVKLMAMVKAFSYGSGSFEIANLLQFHQVDYLAVAYADEGKALRDADIRIPIMVMNPEPTAFETMASVQLEPEIFNFEMLVAWGHWTQKKYPVVQEDFAIHLKIDTGMHRLGFQINELKEIVQKLKEFPHLKIKSVLSHLVASGRDDQDTFTRKQISDFQEFVKEFERQVGYKFWSHISNTDAIARFPEAQFDMVRLGIGMYGLSKHLPGLDPVITLKTHVSQIIQVSKGETVGYNRNGLVHRDTKVATVRVGYADGYDRRFGNGVGQMKIHGVNVPTLGDICMDMCMLDVTDLPHIQVGDEVCVFDDFDWAAQQIQTIPYELLVGISQRVKRLYYYG